MSDEDVAVPSTAEDLSLHVGDTVRTVVQDFGDQGDPVAWIDGTITFIKTPEGVGLEFGETVRVKVADMGDRINAVLDPSEVADGE